MSASAQYPVVGTAITLGIDLLASEEDSSVSCWLVASIIASFLLRVTLCRVLVHKRQFSIDAGELFHEWLQSGDVSQRHAVVVQDVEVDLFAQLWCQLVYEQARHGGVSLCLSMQVLVARKVESEGVVCRPHVKS